MSGVSAQTRFGCYIGNIDRSVTIDMLKQVFCQCGTIIDCSLNGREGDPYRFGFIDFATEDDRARALKYNGFTLVGRKLKVGISKGNVNKPEGYANGNPGGGSSSGHSADRSRQPSNSNYRGSGAGNDGEGGLTTQQQIEARLLLQFLQEGKMDPRQLSPAQQQLLIASLGQPNTHNNNSGTGMMGQQPPMSSAMPIMGGGGTSPMMMSPNNHTNSQLMMDVMGSSGGYGGPGMMPTQQQQRSPQPWGAGMPFGNSGMYQPSPVMGVGPQAPPPQPPAQRPMQGYPQPRLPPLPQHQQQVYGGSGAGVLSGGALVNAPLSAETLRLREKQREQFFEVVRKDTEKYERKLQEKKAQAAAAGGGAGGAERSDSTASDEDEKPTKKSKKEASSS